MTLRNPFHKRSRQTMISYIFDLKAVNNDFPEGSL